MAITPAADAELAPLAGPAVTAAGLMIAAAGIEARHVNSWAQDYGAPLVWTAVVQYLYLAAALLWWGLRQRRARLRTESAAHR